MGRAPCCDKANVKKGPWSPEEDAKLKEFIETYGTGGNWIALPQKAGLKRCGKSCRLRWLNYLRPNIKHGEFSDDEDRIICSLFHSIGSRWSIIAGQLPGRTDNDIKNYWNTKLKKKLMGIVPSSQIMKPINPPSFPSSLSQTLSTTLPSKCCSTSPLLYPLSLKSPSSALEPINISSIPSSNLSNVIINNPNSLPNQPQESLVCSILVGTELTSCSSSDGSCNQISHGKDIETDHHQDPTGQHFGLQSYSSTDGFEEKYDQKMMLDFGRGCNGWTQRSNIGFWGSETPLEYDLEEIKQLVSTNGCSSNYIDETKTTLGRIMYY